MASLGLQNRSSRQTMALCAWLAASFVLLSGTCTLRVHAALRGSEGVVSGTPRQLVPGDKHGAAQTKVSIHGYFINS